MSAGTAPAVAVVDSGAVAPRTGSDAGLTVRRTLGAHTGAPALEQAVLEVPAGGRSGPIDVAGHEETLFVLSGAGTVHTAGDSHPLEAEVGVYLPPGAVFELAADAAGPLRVLAVRIPPSADPADPADPGDPADAADAAERAPVVSRLSDQALQPATTQREFRIVADPATGLRGATHFVGYIPLDRAPDHFHTYDEVIYVIDGTGTMHAGDLHADVGPGACIQLPARTVHCLQNTGREPMRVVAVFSPAGSPAAAYYPDGTPAYAGTTDLGPEEEE